MVQSTDVGSLTPPLHWDKEKYNFGASLIERSFFSKVDLTHDSVKYFAKVFYESFLKKFQAGIEIPCYSQLRDLKIPFKNNYEALLSSSPSDLLITGGPERGIFNPKYTRIAEVEVLRGIKGLENLGKRLCERTGQRPVNIRAEVSDPLLLESKVSVDYLAGLVASCIINTKYVKTKLLALGAPEYGVSVSGEYILPKYDRILYSAKCRNVETTLHAHSFEWLFLKGLKNLDLFECHSNHLDALKSLAEELKNSNKRLCVGIARTDVYHAEPFDLVEGRLKSLVLELGSLVAYAQPDCGLGGRSEKVALGILRNVSKAVRKVRTQASAPNGI